MDFYHRMKVNDFLVKHCRISKDRASEFIEQNRVRINERKAVQKQFIIETDLVELDGKTLQQPVVYKYYALYKPRGIECTLNPTIKNNLRNLIPFEGHFYPVGRLDKQSEGLLLLTNDGHLYQRIALSENFKEKEYEVEVDTELSDEAIQQLATGVLIMRIKKTRPAIVTRIHSHAFRIILTQGLNRQIRRMCHTIGLEVTSLKRVRISSVKLDNLQPGEYKELKAEEI
jgi:23S rRNA pseudouridine2604 synthase